MQVLKLISKIDPRYTIFCKVFGNVWFRYRDFYRYIAPMLWNTQYSDALLSMMTDDHGDISRITCLCVRRTVWCPHKELVVRSFDVFFVLILNKLLTKQSSRRWLGAHWPSCRYNALLLNLTYNLSTLPLFFHSATPWSLMDLFQ